MAQINDAHKNHNSQIIKTRHLFRKQVARFDCAKNLA
jgi:hypothetical protein